ncbi:MAG: hypothetical protein VCF24_26165 [Candidatus Latescibacterota bacterium]
MRFLICFSVLALFLGFATGASAHIGEKVYLIFEIADADLPDIAFDGSIDDWEDVVGPPSLITTDFFQDPTVGAGAQYDPADLDYRIWLAWNQTGNHLYGAVDRLDNVYINEYAGGNPGATWQQDSVEFMVDGDHSGGSYNRNNEDLSDEDKKRHFNAQAQKYNFTFDVPDERWGGYPGGAAWANELPYLSAFGRSTGTNPTRSILEFYVTPFDDLVLSEDDSQVSPLTPGKVIGLQIAMPDYDTAPLDYQAYHTLSGQAATFRFAERFVDARLVGADGATAVEDASWARIKAAVAR